MSAVKVMQCDTELAKVVAASDPPTCLASLLHSGK
jgi:hypothetical protein